MNAKWHKRPVCNTTIFIIYNALYIIVSCSAITGQPNYTLSCLFTSLLTSLNQVCVSLDTHLERHKSKAVCQKPPLILAQFSCMHTWSAEQVPWRNQGKLLSPSIFTDSNPPSKSYHLYICQAKTSRKTEQNSVVSFQHLAWLAKQGALSYVKFKIPGKGEKICKFFLKTIKADKSSFKGIYVRGDKSLHSQVSLLFWVGYDKPIPGGAW